MIGFPVVRAYTAVPFVGFKSCLYSVLLDSIRRITSGEDKNGSCYSSSATAKQLKTLEQHLGDLPKSLTGKEGVSNAYGSHFVGRNRFRMLCFLVSGKEATKSKVDIEGT